MKLPFTFLIENRKYSNIEVMKIANEKLAAENGKQLVPLSEYHKQRRVYMLAKLLSMGATNATTAATLNIDTFEEIDTGTRRSGRTRTNWLRVTMKDMWEEARTDTQKHTAFNNKNKTHRDTLMTYSKS